MEQSANAYLEQEVLSATPAKLRWLLLRKALNLCEIVVQMWRDGDTLVAEQWSLRLRDILSELLGGIHGSDAIARQVADLYIFMIALQTNAEQTRDVSQMSQLRELLSIECETWDLVQRSLVGQLPADENPPLSMKPPKLSAPPPIAASTLFGNSESSLCIDA